MSILGGSIPGTPSFRNEQKGLNIPGKSSEPSLIQRLDLISKKSADVGVSILGGTVRLQYWESILQDSVRASVIFTDTGNTLPRKKTRFGGSKSGKVGVVEGLPVEGGEKTFLKFTDNQGNTLDFSTDSNLFINKITSIPTDGETTNKAYELDLASKEYIDNEEGWSRVRHCLSGQISEEVENILKDNLKTKKDLDIEDTKDRLQYIGNNKKPFYTINELSKKAVSSKNQGSEGNTAGYFFWETANGFHFKSIDTLLTGKQKTSIIYNESADPNPPVGYKIKALSLEMDNRIDVQKKKRMGAYSTRSFLLDPFKGTWECTSEDALGSEGQEKVNNEEIKTAGERLPFPTKEFNSDEADTAFTRTTWNLISTGQLNYGPIEGQLTDSKKINFDYSKIFNQSIRRYNQLFASQITIVIPGDFSLHAGDTVFMDIPESGTSENKACSDEVNKEDGGVYLITDLCHHVTSKETYTKLVLSRDSFGRVGTPTKNESSSNADKVMDPNFLPFIK